MKKILIVLEIVLNKMELMIDFREIFKKFTCSLYSPFFTLKFGIHFISLIAFF